MHTVTYARAWDKWVPILIEDDILSLVVFHSVKTCQVRLAKQIFPSDLVNLIIKYSQLTKDERSCHDNKPKEWIYMRAFKQTKQFHWEDSKDYGVNVSNQNKQLYHSAIRVTLVSIINCILPSSSMGHPQIIDGLTNYPCVEMIKYNKGLLLNPVIISRNKYEQVLIEGSINSVRISFKFAKYDDMTKYLTHLYCKIFMNRCELFDIIRRKPINQDWDLTFLIMFWHLEYKQPSICINDNHHNGDQDGVENNESRERLYDHPCFDRLCLIRYLSQFVKEFENVISEHTAPFLTYRSMRVVRTWLKQF